MKNLLNIYKLKLLGITLLIIGFSVIFGTILYVSPINREEQFTYFEMLGYSLKYSTIIILGISFVFFGIDCVTNHDKAHEFMKNIKNAFSKNK